MIDHIAAAQREAAQAQRKSIGQVSAEQKRGQREDERNAKRRSGGKVPTARGRRAPKSASQFHLTKKYSNRVGKNKAPSSALKKLAYDFRLTLLDDQGRKISPGTKKNDLAYSYTVASPETPKDALDLAKIGQESERTAGRQGNSRQMTHIDIALPTELSDDGKHALVRSITNHTHTVMDRVPVFSAMHLPHKGNDNYHLHLSHPLRHIEPVGDDGAFRMTDRIMFEQRPSVREAAGLAKSNREDLKQYRQEIANLIADSLEKEGNDSQLVERWRHGHLTLAQQVEQAVKRGDVEFVIDNFGRAATRHEGPATNHGIITTAASEHNADAVDSIDAALLTGTMINSVLDTAKRFQIIDPEHVRMLALDMGLQLNWSKDRESGLVRGLQWQIVGGPKLSGSAAGCSLADLKRKMDWSDTPAYNRTIAREGASFDAYKQILGQHGKAHLAGRGVSILDQVIKRQIEAKDAAVAAAQAQAVERQRPKRASSKNKDSLNSRKSEKEPQKMDAKDIKALLATLTKLPEPEQTPPKAAPPPRAPTKAQIEALTSDEQVFLIDRYDQRQPDFKTPARDAARRVTLAREALAELEGAEPWPRTETFKRFFRKSIKRETAEHAEWSTRVAEAQLKFDQLHEKVAQMLNERVYSDPVLLAMLPAFHQEQADKAAQQAKAKQEKHDADRKAFRQKMEDESMRTGEHLSKKSSMRERPG